MASKVVLENSNPIKKTANVTSLFQSHLSKAAARSDQTRSILVDKITSKAKPTQVASKELRAKEVSVKS